MDANRLTEIEWHESAAVRSGNERRRRSRADAKASAARRRDPGDGVPPWVAGLDPEIATHAAAVRARLEARSGEAERRFGDEHA